MNKVYTYLRNTGSKLKETHPVVQGIAFSACCLILFLVFISIIFTSPHRRHLFFFPAGPTFTARTEIRYLPSVKGQDTRLELFVRELCMGPIDPAYSALFDRAVRPLRCFIRDDRAYIDLSPEAEDYLASGVPPETAFKYFKKNVFTNFRNVDMIYIYIKGIEVYSSDTGVTASTEK